MSARAPRGRAGGLAITIGVDTGGTFTDLVCLAGGRARVLKVPSTPDDPARAIVSGVAALLDALRADRAAARPDAAGGDLPIRLVHGSTVATNTILERKGARTLFITTAGFGDIIEIGRQNRAALYDLEVARPAPLVPARLRLEARERVDASGAVLEPLDVEALRRALAALRARGDGAVEAVAIGFLFSPRFAAHEKAAARCVRAALPRRPVTLSSRVSPEPREYERFSTAVLNAYVAPRMTRYLDRLRKGLPSAAIEVMGSGGGTVSLARARAEPVQTILSGPAAGVLGARALAARSGHERVITFDMGGTSTDVSLVDGEAAYRGESSIGGLPFRIPVIDVHTVGAGGGSIARVDAGGALRVGPESAGADPGPAVYGKGEDITVTDAHAFLGHLDAGSLLGGALPIFPERARAGMEALARKLRMPPAAVAHGILRVADAEMERALRVVSQERGHDPRRFTLVAFGGASGLHAAALARGLLIPRILVPLHPGTLCARGMLGAKRVRWRARPIGLAAERCTTARLDRAIASLSAVCLEDFEGVAPARLEHRLELDLRFRGQTHVIPLAWQGSGPRPRPPSDHVARFRALYREQFGIDAAEWEIEVVTARLCLALAPEEAKETPARRRPRRAAVPVASRRRVLGEDGRSRGLRVYRRDDLRAGDVIAGPAIVGEYSGTTLVPRGHRLEVDGRGQLLIELALRALSATRR